MVKAMTVAGASAESIEAAIGSAEREEPRSGSRQLALLEAPNLKKRGTRLPDKWQPSERCIAYALDHGMSSERIEREIERFKNYWLEKTGAGATKITWEGTWKNWVLTATDGRHAPTGNNNGRRYRSSPTTGRAPTGSDAILAGMARIARRIDERRDAKVDERRKISAASDDPREFDFE
jgi:hypothetical protein